MLIKTRAFIDTHTHKKKLQKISTDDTGQQNASDAAWESCIKGVVMRERIRCTAISAY